MILCQYNFELPLDPYQLMPLANQAITDHGGTVTGELPEVSIRIPLPIGHIEGACKLVSDNTIHVAVTKKPELITCDMIRDKLVEYLKEGVQLQHQMNKANAGQME